MTTIIWHPDAKEQIEKECLKEIKKDEYTKDDDFIVLLEILKLKFKYNITEKRFKELVKMVYKKPTKKEKKLLEKYINKKHSNS